VTNRYAAHGSGSEFEPGSRGRVMRNLRRIKSVREMEQHESEALLATTHRLIDTVRADQRFNERDIRDVHKDWLGGTYEWAGEYRRINVAKGNFMFAAAGRVPQLMRAFALGPLRELTPCSFTDIDEQSHALAVVHTELVLIHPFRDGNGRCARLLSVLMGLQAGLPVLDFSGIRGEERRRYFLAAQGGLDRNYRPMTQIFRRVIERTLRQPTNV